MTESVSGEGEQSLPDLEHQLVHDGLEIDYGACLVRVRSAAAGFLPVFERVYQHFPITEPGSFSDFHVRLEGGRGLRRLVRPVSRFRIDGVEPFEPFPASDAFPMYEWGVNWCFAQRFNQFVLLHAGVLARHDRAVIMAATPGSGKSTLSAAMMLSGFRLLSDEFGVLDPDTGEMMPMLKPVALKNQSIGIISGFSQDAVLGPTFKATRKGDVAHLAPDLQSVEARHQRARPALVIFPAYRAGAELELKPQDKEQVFSRLAFNSFNYALLGKIAFDAVADIADGVPAYELRYSRLDEAIARVDQLLSESATLS